MRCRRTKKSLWAYIEGALSVRQRDLVEEHLEGCARCREELSWLRLTRSALAHQPFPAPPHDFTERTLARIAAQGRDRRRPRLPAFVVPRFAWAAVGAILIAAFGLWRLAAPRVQRTPVLEPKRLAKAPPVQAPVEPRARRKPLIKDNRPATVEPGERGYGPPRLIRQDTPGALSPSLEPNERDRLLAQAQALVAAGSFDQAAAVLRPMYERNPEDRAVSFGLARALAGVRQPDEAAKVCRRLLRDADARTAGQLHMLLAEAYKGASRWSEALEQHVAAASLTQDYSVDGGASVAGGHILTSARSLIAEGESRQGLDQCQTLLEHFSPDSPIAHEARLLASEAFGVMGDKALGQAVLVPVAEASADAGSLERPTKTPPEDSLPQTLLTVADEMTWERAMALMESARRMAQDHPNPRDVRERYRQAKAILEKLASGGDPRPQVSDARFRLAFAQVREALGDRQGAIRDYAVVANNHPDTEEAEIAKQHLAALT